MKNIKGSIHRDIQHRLYSQLWKLIQEGASGRIWVNPHNLTVVPIRGQINFTFLEQLKR